MFARSIVATLCIRFSKRFPWHRLEIRNTNRFSFVVNHNSDGSIEMSLNKDKWLLNAVHHFWFLNEKKYIHENPGTPIQFHAFSFQPILWSISHFYFFYLHFTSSSFSNSNMVHHVRWIFEMDSGMEESNFVVGWSTSKRMIFNLLNVCHSEFGLW